MKNVINLLFFLICTTGVFFVDNHIVILAIIAINLLIIYILKIQIKEILKFFSKILLFVILTVIFNLAMGNLSNAILLGIKLIIVCNITFLYSKNTTSAKLAKAIESLLFPLKAAKIDTRDIAIIICIAITFIPILNNELINFKNNLKSKSYKLSYRNLLIIFEPFLASVIKRIDEIDKTLKVKAYE